MQSSVLAHFRVVFALRQRRNFVYFCNMLSLDDFYGVLKGISQKTSPITSMMAILALVRFLVSIIMT